jgi:hypothetical protein
MFRKEGVYLKEIHVSSSKNSKQNRKYNYNVTLRRVRVAVVAMEKQ